MLHCAMVRATCLATSLRNKLHEQLMHTIIGGLSAHIFALKVFYLKLYFRFSIVAIVM